MPSAPGAPPRLPSPCASIHFYYKNSPRHQSLSLCLPPPPCILLSDSSCPLPFGPSHLLQARSSTTSSITNCFLGSLFCSLLKIQGAFLGPIMLLSEPFQLYKRSTFCASLCLWKKKKSLDSLFFFSWQEGHLPLQPSRFWRPPPSPKSTRTGPPPIQCGALCREFPEHSPGLEAHWEWRGFGQGASLKPTPLPRSLFALGSLKGLLLPVARYSLATLKPSCLLYLWQKLFNGLQNTCLSTWENTFKQTQRGEE